MNQKGFTVLEALLAMFLLGVVLTGLVPGFLTFLDTNTMSEENSDAVAAAQLVLERLRLQDPGALPSSGSTGPEIVNVGGREFEVLNHYCTVADFCGTDSRHIRVEVTYGGETLFEIESVYTRLQ
jgi:type II secretory pathway pseudopilin PulG